MFEVNKCMAMDADAGHGLIERLSQFGCTLVRRVVDGVREWLERRRRIRELARLDRRDLDRVLGEIGCSRDELAILIRSSAAPRPLLGQMILRLGLERAFMHAGQQMTREIELRCSLCSNHRQCVHWLRTRGDDEGYRRFCPNAGNFDLLALQS